MKGIFIQLLAVVLDAGLLQAQPVVTTDLTNQTILNGSNVTFIVAVSGTGPITYQWQFNGTNLPNNIITTVAGNGTNGFAGDGGIATNGELRPPYGVAADGNGNFYIADTGDNRIRMVNTNGIIMTIVGKGNSGGPGAFGGDNGPATNAYLNQPIGVSVDQFGNVNIADTYNSRIRMVKSNGNIMTVAGNGFEDFGGDGLPATGASLWYPQGVVADGYGNIFIADTYNDRIRKVDTNGYIWTVAGTNSSGFGGDGGPATNAVLDGPCGIALDNYGDIFFSDGGNNRIREVNTNGIITTVAGGGSGGDGGAATNASLSTPKGVAIDAGGNLFIADEFDNRIRQVDTDGIITTVAGTGNLGYSGDGGTATNANLYYPCGVAINDSGGLYVADTGNNRIRAITLGRLPFLSLNGVTTNNAGNYQVMITSPSGSITSSIVSLTVVFPPAISSQPQSIVVTNGSPAQFAIAALGTGPFDYQWYGGTNELLDATNSTLIFSNATATEAGNYTCVITNNYASVTSFVATLTVLTPPAIISQSTTNQVVFYGTNLILNVAMSGTGPFSYQWQFNGTNLPNKNNTISLVAGNESSSGFSGDGGLATNALMNNPSGLAIDSAGDIFIVDQMNNCIRMVRTNYIYTVAGIGAVVGYSGDGGPATNARLNLNSSTSSGIAVDSFGNIYIADPGNNRIRKVNTNGIIMTMAGTNTAGFSGDGGPATNAQLRAPYGVAVDSSGDVFVADTGNNRIRKINTNGLITTVAGTNLVAFSGDGGPAVNAKLSTPNAVAVDATGNLFINDSGDNRIRKVDFNGVITTVAGTGTIGYSGDGGPATQALLDFPNGITVDAYDDIFIADNQNSRIRMVSTSGLISTVAGNGVRAYLGDGGNPTNASIDSPRGVGLDLYGNLYLASTPECPVHKVDFGQNPNLQLNNVGATNTGNYDVIVTSPYGSVTSSIVSLTVISPPVIVTQPTNATVPIGSSFNLNVVVSNYPPFAYQWFAASGRPARAEALLLGGRLYMVGVVDRGEGYISTPNVQFIGGGGSGATATAIVAGGQVSELVLTFPGSGYTSPPAVKIDPPPNIGSAALLDETNATLTFLSVSSSDATNYFVVISNSYGSVTSNIVGFGAFLTPQNFTAQYTGTGIQLGCAGTPNFLYTLQSATNLTPPINWVSFFPPVTADSNGNWTFTDTNLSPVQKYYRVEGQ